MPRMRKLTQKQIDKATDARVERAYRQSCCGVQVNIMDIPKIFNFGRIKCAAGVTDAELAGALRWYVDNELARP